MQEFEKYPKLTTYIEKLASYGSCLSGSEWNAFLGALNEALKISSNTVLADSLPNCCEECSKELESGTVFCCADCRRHYYS